MLSYERRKKTHHIIERRLALVRKFEQDRCWSAKFVERLETQRFRLAKRTPYGNSVAGRRKWTNRKMDRIYRNERKFDAGYSDGMEEVRYGSE